MTGIKFAATGAVVSLVGQSLTATAQDIAVIAAGCAGVSYVFWRVIIPIGKVARRALTAYETLETIPAVYKILQELREQLAALAPLPGRLQSLEGRVTVIESTLSAIVESSLSAIEGRIDELEQLGSESHERITAVTRELGVHHRGDEAAA